MLGIERADAERGGGVNREVTAALAGAALHASHAELAIAITGFCGPQQDDEEVGLVFIALAERGGRTDERVLHLGDIGRRRVLDSAVASAIELLCDAVNSEAARPLSFDTC